MKDKKTGKIVLLGETKHCFTDKNLKPINMKKYNSEFNRKMESLLQDNPCRVIKKIEN